MYEANNRNFLPKRVHDLEVAWATINPHNLRYVPCVLCGSPVYESLFSLRINMVEFFLVRCSRCGLIWRNPLPDDEFLQSLYSEAYFNVESISLDLIYQVGIRDVTSEDHARRKLIAIKEIDDWISRGIAGTSNETLRFLEVGGGRGYLQRAAAEKGWETLGIELSSHAIKNAIATGLNVLPITLWQLHRDYVPYAHYFDIIALFDFLEHVTDPSQVLGLIRDLMTDSGFLIIRIPITKDFPELHLIDHIWHFTVETITMLSNREGFQILSQHDSGIFCSPDGKQLDNITLFLRKSNV